MLDYQTAQEMLKAITESDDPEAELAKLKAKHSSSKAKSHTIFGVTQNGKVSVTHFD